MGPIASIKNYLISILSGAFVPIWFFPKTVQNILSFFPFVYTYQQPLGIYIGRTSTGAVLKGMSIQVIWILIFFILFSKLEKRAFKNIMVQGG
jgi:ABC-2 type transport system permease protein